MTALDALVDAFSTTPARWLDRPVTTLGLSRTGEAVAVYLARLGANVLASDRAPADATNAAARARLIAMGCDVETGGHSDRCLSHAPLMIVSPGIPPHADILRRAAGAGVEIISEVELAARENRATRRLPLVAITGSNGKTTTTTLIARLLNAADRRAIACGNIGLPMIACLQDEAVETLVAELSSAQLAFSPTLQADVAVFLNLTPDHLQWHGSLEAYEAAKRRLLTGAQAPTWAVVNADDPAAQRWEPDLPAQTVWFSRRDPAALAARPHAAFLDADGRFILRRDGQDAPTGLTTRDLQLKGAHNHENVLAALAAAALLTDAFDAEALAPLVQACRDFEGVEHRIEPVGVIARKRWRIALYNDSKATNTDATIQALRAFAPQKVVLIAGGRPKDEPAEQLARFASEVKAHARAVALLGEAQALFHQTLTAAGFEAVYDCDTLERALDQALTLSEGEPILLSPACASFDQFENFEHRGETFKALVAKRQEAGPAWN